MNLLLLAGLAYVVLISLILLFNFGAARASRDDPERFQGPEASDFDADPAIRSTFVTVDQPAAPSTSNSAARMGSENRNTADVRQLTG